jgi:hypothetical protein
MERCLRQRQVQLGKTTGFVEFLEGLFSGSGHSFVPKGVEGQISLPMQRVCHT